MLLNAGYIQQQQQQALEKQQNINAMATLNNLFEVTKQPQERQQQVFILSFFSLTHAFI